MLASCAGNAGAALTSPPALMFLDKPIMLAPRAHWVTAVAFSPDGATLVGAGANGKVRLWSVGTGKLTSTLEGPSRSLNDVAVSPDGQRIVAVCAGTGPFLGLGSPRGGELWI